MFQRILVPLDGSPQAERVLPLAARLVRASGGSLLLLHVVTTTQALDIYLDEPSLLKQELLEGEIARGAGYLASVVKTTPELAGIQVRIALYSGAVTETMLHVIRQQHIDLVALCMTTEGRNQHGLRGSITGQLLHQCPVPVLLVHPQSRLPVSPYPDPSRPLRGVCALVALDGSSRAEQTLLPAIHLVAALATPAWGKVHLTQVLTSSEHDERDIRLAETETSLAALAQRYHHQAEALHVVLSWSVVKGTHVAEGLIRLAEHGTDELGTVLAGGCDLLALATRGRSGVARLLLGSVATSIVEGTSLPVLVIRASEEHPLRKARVEDANVSLLHQKME